MITTILIFIAILGLLVFVHELGHFFAARAFGVTVHEFGFGFPPRIFGIRKGSTLYSLNWIPLGGFVKLKGEGGEEAEQKDSFANLPAGKRVIILVNGVLMNIVLAMLLLGIGYGVGSPTVIGADIPPGGNVRDQKIQVVSIADNSPASAVGFEEADVIVSVNDQSVTSVTQIQNIHEESPGAEELVVLRRGDEEIERRITPAVLDESSGAPVWGVSLVESGIVSYPWYQAVYLGVKQAILIFWEIIKGFALMISNLVVHRQVSADVAGPVGIAVLTGQVANLGFIYLLQFMALLSLNLALVNILPFPALDGGRAFFVLIEKLRGKAMQAKTEALIHNVGFGVLLVFIAIVTVRDVGKFGGGITKFFQDLVGRIGG